MEKIKIRMNKKFYRKEVIEEALKDFEKIAEGKIINDFFEIELNPKKDIEKLDFEFSNYVIGLIKNKSIV